MDVISAAIVVFCLFIGPFLLLVVLALRQVIWLGIQAHRARRGFERFCRDLGCWNDTTGDSNELTVGSIIVKPFLYGSRASIRKYEELRGSDPHFMPPTPTLSSGCILGLLVKCDCPVSFALSREKLFDKLGKAIGISLEPQVDDRAFDSSVYISCDDQAFIASYLTGERRDTVLTLLKGEFQLLSYSKSGGELTLWSTHKFLASKNALDVKELVRQFVSLVDETQASRAAPSPQIEPVAAPEPSVWWDYLVTAAGVYILYANTFTYFSSTFSGQGLWIYALVSGAIMLALFMRRAWGGAKKKSTSHRMLTWNLIGAIFLFPAVSALVIGCANNLFDFSSEEIREAKIIAVRGSFTRRHRVEFLVRHEQGGSGRAEFPIADERKGELEGKIGKTMKVWVRSGAFGFRYVTGIEAAG